MKIINYNNKLFSVIFKKINENKWSAKIAVEGAVAEGESEEDAFNNLKEKLNEITIRNNIGKNRLLFG